MCDQDSERLGWGSLICLQVRQETTQPLSSTTGYVSAPSAPRFCFLKYLLFIIVLEHAQVLLVMMNVAKIGQLFPTRNMGSFHCHKQSFGTKRINYCGNISNTKTPAYTPAWLFFWIHMTPCLFCGDYGISKPYHIRICTTQSLNLFLSKIKKIK
jgi:hypothetical protein